MAEPVAITRRLRLRAAVPEDAQSFEAHCNTPAVMRHLGGVQPPGAMDALADRLIACQAEHGHSFWIVERLEDDAFLGFCGLKRVDAPGAPNPGDFEIGWRLREDAWGKGYAREAAAASLDLAFSRFAAPHVVAFTLEDNRASWGLMLRLGMKRRPDLDFVDDRHPGEITIVHRIAREDRAAA